MRQKTTDQLRKRFPSLYHQFLLDWRREQLGWSQRETARRANANLSTIRKVFKGLATSTKVYPIARVLGVDWVQLHNLDLQESDFHLAVRNGNGRVKRAVLGGGSPE